MKKHKKSKIIVVIAIICLLMGSIFVGVGLAKGGSLRYMSLNSNTVSWWPFRHGDFEFSFGNTFGNEKYTYSENIDNISSLHISIDIGDVEIRRGGQNKVTFKGIDKEYINFKNSGGKLDIEVNNSSILKMNNHGSVLIYVQDKVYDSIRISNSLGDVELQNIQAREFDIDTKLGDLDLEGITSEKLTVDQKCGDISIEGRLLGNTQIQNKLGETDIEVNERMEEYYYTVKNSLGDTSIQDNDYDLNANISGGRADAKNSLRVENSVGDVSIEFR